MTQPWDMNIDFSKVDRNQPLTLMAFDLISNFGK